MGGVHWIGAGGENDQFEGVISMNVEAINQLADFIESGKYEFDMRKPIAHPECGSAGCIGGHASVLWPEVEKGLGGFNCDTLAERLGIGWNDAQDLCFPELPDYGKITREIAVSALRRMAETGEVAFVVEEVVSGQVSCQERHRSTRRLCMKVT